MFGILLLPLAAVLVRGQAGLDKLLEHDAGGADVSRLSERMPPRRKRDRYEMDTDRYDEGASVEEQLLDAEAALLAEEKAEAEMDFSKHEQLQRHLHRHQLHKKSAQLSPKRQAHHQGSAHRAQHKFTHAKFHVSESKARSAQQDVEGGHGHHIHRHHHLSPQPSRRALLRRAASPPQHLKRIAPTDGTSEPIEIKKSKIVEPDTTAVVTDVRRRANWTEANESSRVAGLVDSHVAARDAAISERGLEASDANGSSDVKDSREPSTAKAGVSADALIHDRINDTHEHLKYDLHVDSETGADIPSRRRTKLRDRVNSWRLFKTKLSFGLNGMQCMEENPMTGKVYVALCKSHPNQHFRIVDEHILYEFDDYNDRFCVDKDAWRMMIVKSAKMSLPDKPYGFFANSYVHCRSICFANEDCEQAVYYKPLKNCYLTKVSREQDSDDMGGLNVDYVTSHCYTDKDLARKGRCLTYQEDTGDVIMSKCIDGRNQKWHQDNGTIRAAINNRCLGIKHLMKCNENFEHNKVAVLDTCKNGDLHVTWQFDVPPAPASFGERHLSYKWNSTNVKTWTNKSELKPGYLKDMRRGAGYGGFKRKRYG